MMLQLLFLNTELCRPNKSDVFGLLRETRGMRQTLAGKGGEEGEAEDRESGVGDRTFPDRFNPEERR